LSRNTGVLFTVVRHGQSLGNLKQAWEGSGSNSPLSELGHQQADVTGEYLAASGDSFAALYSSPLKRAIQTADSISQSVSVSVETLDSLQEMNLGEVDGIGVEEVKRRYPDIVSLWGPQASTPFPGGESSRSTAKRGAEAFHAIARAHSPGEQIIVVSHQALITLALSMLLNDEEAFMDYQTANCSVSALELGEQARLISLGYTGHLEESGLATGKVLPDA
jgi:probable phosphoglycerate mutase